MANRTDRRYDTATPDQRAEFERDRDRVLYSSAFRRLGGVTQVVATFEGHLYHNRLTHSLKVAQVSRRLAEYLLKQYSRSIPGLSEILSPDVCETAGLAHDLGHPPFGHVAEGELDELVLRHDEDGFEGNAQTFRILTRLSAHRGGYPGLDLCRASLASVLKYPYMRNGAQTGAKFGAYSSEALDFKFARAGQPGMASLEAGIMEYADDVSYSVHDLEDFLRAGLLPVHRLGSVTGFKDVLSECCEAQPEGAANLMRRQEGDILRLAQMLTVLQYDGTRQSRAALRNATSVLIGRYVRAARLLITEDDERTPYVVHNPDTKAEMLFLQGLLRVWVIEDPRLASQQEGTRQIIRFLYAHYLKACRSGKRALVPPAFAHQVDRALTDGEAARLAADIVASLTDSEAVTAFRRLSGVSIGSIHDRL